MIAVIGDVMLDEFWFGETTRFTPESQNTPIVKLTNIDKRLGGAANVALNINKLDQNVKLFGAVGEDEAGIDVKSLLEKHSLNSFIIKKSCKTTRKIRVYTNKTYTSRIDVEERIQYNQEQVLEAIKKYNADYLVLSDYNKGVIQDAKSIIQNCGLKTFVDPKSALENYSGSFVLKPNLSEFTSWANLTQSFDIESFIHDNYFKLINARNKLKVINLIITCGEDGCILVTEKVRLFRAPTTNTVDVTGAGDTFLAALVCKFKETDNIIKAIQYANLAASIAVSKKGTAYVESSELKK
jgi:D-beta-D-heptose 7-phosphate kinase/D-beta-D-heptose 1-phosphate adenosyltransferase